MPLAYDIQHYTYTYPLEETPALRDITISIQQGKFYGIVGANNAGKSSLCLALKGYIATFYHGSYSGTINVQHNGLMQPLTEASKYNNIGFVFSDPFTQLSRTKETVFEEIALTLENRNVAVQEIIQRVEHIMQQLHLTELAMKNPQMLSGGQVQCIALASIIVADPQILILDEPTVQLDPKESEHIYRFLRRYADNGNTVICAEQNTDLLAQYVDELLVLEKGTIILSGHCDDVFYDTRFPQESITLPSVVQLVQTLRARGVPIEQNITHDDQLIAFIKEHL